MKRTTVMLPPDLVLHATRRARDLGISFGGLVRESLAAAVWQTRRDPAVLDPFWADDAVYTGPVPRRLSTDHDRYLYDQPDEP